MQHQTICSISAESESLTDWSLFLKKIQFQRREAQERPIPGRGVAPTSAGAMGSMFQLLFKGVWGRFFIAISQNVGEKACEFICIFPKLCFMFLYSSLQYLEEVF